MKKKGFTLVELSIGVGIIIIVFTFVFTTYITMQKLWRGGFTQITFQSRGRTSLAKISRNLRSSTTATIFTNGDGIRFDTDPNGTQATTADDITCEYSLIGTDIIYDPDISIVNDEVTLLLNVFKEPAIPLFQISGDLIIVTFRLFNADPVYGTYWSSMTTTIKMRNI